MIYNFGRIIANYKVKGIYQEFFKIANNILT